jgi:hypothetical protein
VFLDHLLMVSEKLLKCEGALEHAAVENVYAYLDGFLLARSLYHCVHLR